MTGQSVSIIITLKVGSQSKQIEKEIQSDDLETSIKDFGHEISCTLFQQVIDLLDQQLKTQVPKDWKNLGTAKRSVVFQAGCVSYQRRIYQDSQGQRWKPIDMLLGIAPYARNSLKVQEMGCVLASRSSYRNASEMLVYLLKTFISPSSLQRMMLCFGAQIDAIERDWQVQREAGKQETKCLYGESDGVWLHLQQERQKRMEAKVGLLYTGKKAIGVGRFACENKVVMTQLGGSNEEWQIKIRELADHHFDLSKVKHLVVGGDGAAWVKHSFDLLCLPQIALLDRFHLCRAVHRSLKEPAKSWSILERIRSTPFEEVKPELLLLQNKARGRQAKDIQTLISYLSHNQDALLDLEYRGIPELSPSTLGAAEGNVDKIVRQRMRGRGLSWSIGGAQAMLTILRHQKSLLEDALGQPETRVTRRGPKQRFETDPYTPPAASLPVFSSVDNAKPWVQLLRNRMAKELSLTALF